MTSQALTTQPGNAPLAPRDASPHGQLKRQLQTREVDFHAALASKGISVRDFLGSISTAVAQDPELLNADRSSLILSCLRAAQDGLHPDKREAALVIFNQRRKNDRGKWETVKLVQYMPMVYGLRKKILQAKDAIGKPVVSALQVGVVYRIEVEQGYFLWERGSDPEVQHRPMLEIPEEEATDDKIVAAYSIATMADGTRSCEVMRRFEINKVRQMSQTGAEGQKAKWDDEKNGIKKGDPVPPKGPWVDWFAEMAKKTVMRRHAKTLPMSGDVIASLGEEDENQYTASALALASGSGDAPALIEDGSGDKFDPATGEIIEEGANEATSKKSRSRKSSAGTGTEATSANLSNERVEQATSESTVDQQVGAGQSATSDASHSKSVAEQIDEHPAEAKANEILAAFKKAETIIDLERLYGRNEADIEAMPEDIRSAVDGGYNSARVRLGGARVAETAAAK